MLEDEFLTGLTVKGRRGSSIILPLEGELDPASKQDRLQPRYAHKCLRSLGFRLDSITIERDEGLALGFGLSGEGGSPRLEPASINTPPLLRTVSHDWQQGHRVSQVSIPGSRLLILQPLLHAVETFPGDDAVELTIMRLFSEGLTLTQKMLVIGPPGE
jgi:hypothetical protein